MEEDGGGDNRRNRECDKELRVRDVAHVRSDGTLDPL
jgi:hypothetical protein